MADKGKTMTLLLSQLIFCGLVFYVISDQSCDKSMEEANVVKSYAESVGSTNMMICSEYSQIKCGQDYAPSLLEKRPTLFYDIEGKCEYLTILFFGKYEDCNSTSLLWFYYNVPADDLKHGFTGQNGNEMVIYTKPKNSEAPANHVFFVYCQSESFENFYCCGTEERDNCDVKSFADTKELGNPVAGLYFEVTANGQIMNSTSDSNNSKKGDCPENN